MAYGPTSIGGYMALSPATKDDIGGVKIGNGINIAEDGTISIDVSVDTVFPVRSIYLSRNNTSPAELFGGTWVKIASDRVLMGASSTHAADTTVEAGLPNIKFSFTAADIGSGSNLGSSWGGSVYSSQFNLDASKSNPIYGASNTVQPAAYYVHIWKRVS